MQELLQSFMNLNPCKRIELLGKIFIPWIVELFQKRTVQMSKLQRSFLKYIRRKPSFKEIMLCSALLLLAAALLQFSKKFLDASLSTYGTMASLGIVILVGIL